MRKKRGKIRWDWMRNKNRAESRGDGGRNEKEHGVVIRYYQTRVTMVGDEL
jgi:hypothetical protein